MCLWLVLMTRVIPPQGWNFALCLVEVREVSTSPFLWPGKVPLDGSVTLCSAIHTSQHCVICQLLRVCLPSAMPHDPRH